MGTAWADFTIWELSGNYPGFADIAGLARLAGMGWVVLGLARRGWLARPAWLAGLAGLAGWLGRLGWQAGRAGWAGWAGLDGLSCAGPG